MMTGYLCTILQILLLPTTLIAVPDSQACRSIVISPDITVLNCSHTMLTELLELPETSRQTTVLDLSHDNLKSLPEFITPTSFPKVEHLNLSHNLITDKLPQINLFTNLRSLDLSFNNILDMAELVCPPNVVKLSLQNNRISVVNLNMDFVNLRELYLQNNDISDFHIDIKHMGKENTVFNWQILNMSGNHLNHVNETYFEPFRNLQKLYLANNGIVDIAENTFMTLVYLEIIDLSMNALTAIPLKLFTKNEHLKYLDLSRNHLQIIPANLPMLDWLDVSFNRISNINEDYNHILYPVRVFLIGGNPFQCTCEMMWLKELFNVRKYLMKYLKMIDSSKFIPVCDKPEKLKGKRWDHLEDDVFECSGLVDQDLKLTNEKIASVLNEDVLKATEVTEDTIIVKWKIISTVRIESVELIYYPFGKKKENLKTIKLSSKTTTYSINMLEANTPYVVCLYFSVDKPLSECIEVITTDPPASWIMVVIGSFFSLVKARLDLVAITIGIMTLLYIVYIFIYPE